MKLIDKALLISLIYPIIATSVIAAPPEKLLQKLERHDAHIARHPSSNKIHLLSTRKSKRLPIAGATASTLPATASRKALEHYGPLFGIDHPGKQMKLVKQRQHRNGGVSHLYQQVIDDIPVLAGEILVQLDGSRSLVAMTGEAMTDFEDLPTEYTLDPINAGERAVNAVAKWRDIPENTLEVSAKALWVVAPALILPSDRSPLLTWRVEVVSRSPIRSVRELLFIDANEGGVVIHMNLLEQGRERKTHDADDTSALPGLLVCDEADPDCAAGDTTLAQAHKYAGDTYNFFADEHGRDSIDDAGLPILSTVRWNDGLSCPNAFWNGAQAVYCRGMIADDVIAHELTHGITEHTSNLLYYYQAGAISESLSDIWGEFVDLTNNAGSDEPSHRWELGEDLEAIGVIRYMADPPLYGDPDRMSSHLYHYSSTDNGGVHTNSGIGNKAAFLMTDGGSFNGHTIAGIGIAKVADIFYEAQSNLLTSGSDYGSLYTALLQSCDSLIGQEGISDIDCTQVRNALDAVEMAQDPADFHPEADVCSAEQQPEFLFLDDIESGSQRWLLGNITGSSEAWLLGSGYVTSGDKMLWGRDAYVNTDATAELTNDINLPANGKAFLHFSHAFGFEPSYDGGWLEFSTNGGQNWEDAGSLIDAGQHYNVELDAYNAHAGQPAFSADSHGYVSTRLDLSSLAGESVRFRWRISTDYSVNGAFGWVLDDVKVYSCENHAQPNEKPQIQSMGATHVELSDAGYSRVYADATDPDNGPQPLVYFWRVLSGGGYLSDDTSLSPIYYPPNIEGSTPITLSISVNDGIDTTSQQVQLMVSDAGGDLPLQIGIVDEGSYGAKFGSNQHQLSFEAVFEGGQGDLVLSLDGFDIDYDDEVAVYLNNTFLGYLRAGPDNAISEDNRFLILSSQQLDGINRIEFRQRTSGFKWGVTNLLLDAFDGVLLTAGSVDSGAYGNNYGSNQNRVIFEVAFESTSTDLVLKLDGYDIDYADEVAVYVNEQWLGHLIVGPNDALNGGDAFVLPASLQNVGGNLVQFRQKTPGFKWGVTNLALTKLENPLPLVRNVAASGPYGNSYGSNQHQSMLAATFEATGADLAMLVSGFDIDHVNELAIYLNNRLITHLSDGPNGVLNAPELISLPLAMQNPGLNLLEFRQQYADEQWGVEALTLLDIALIPGATVSGDYGPGFTTQFHGSSIVAAFEGLGSDLNLSVRGYDIDSADEVTVLLNGSLLYNLRKGSNNAYNSGDTLPIMAAQQQTGVNLIEFRQTLADDTWGVSGVSLAPIEVDVQLTEGTTDDGAYGYRYGTGQNDMLLRASFDSTGVDYRLSLTGYDIDYQDEVAVYLNDLLLGYLSVGNNDGHNDGDSFYIATSMQQPGTNLLDFRQRTPGFKWGVTQLSLTTPPLVLELVTGSVETGEFGNKFGTDQHESLLVARFDTEPQNFQLSLTGFDIDYDDEISLYLNGELIGFLSSGENDGYNAGDVFDLWASELSPGVNWIEFRQRTEGYKWGITDISLQFMVTDVHLNMNEEDSGSYGHKYGSNENRVSLRTSFQGSDQSLTLAVTGYDIDYSDEVSVYLNGHFLTYLSVGPNNSLNSGDSITLPLSAQISGSNVLEFRQRTENFKWGVTKLLISQ